MTGDRGSARETSEPRSLGSQADISLVVALVAAVIGGLVVWIGFSNLLEARAQLFDRLGPARVSTEKLRTSLLDQETGIRGFAQTHDPRFLEPYDAGQRSEAEHTRDLRRLIMGSTDEASEAELLEALDAVGDAASAWRRDVATPILATTSEDSGDAAVIISRTVFDRVRARLNDMEDLVRASESQARSDLDAATSSLAIAVGAALLLVTGAGFYGAWLLRRRVILPIERLVAQTDSVDMGRFDSPIDVSGPEEIEALAVRVDGMRRRIVAELALAEESAAELDRRSQSLERSNRDLEQFAYVASHDLQEPLRKVASFCQLLEQRYADQLDDKGRLYIDYAVDGAKRMQTLIAGLLEFSRVGRTTERFVPCDMAATFDRVVDSLSVAIESSDAHVTHGELPTVPGDPALLTALLQNLTTNAIKYRRPDVPPRIRLDASESGGAWTFTFTDNGIGIEESFREKVFVIFQRLHGRDTYEGTGIGLALCKKIVEFHGGDIWIEDPPPEGGTVVRWTHPLGASVDGERYDSRGERDRAAAAPTGADGA